MYVVFSKVFFSKRILSFNMFEKNYLEEHK